MAKTGPSHDKNLPVNRLVLTGDSKNDWALWQLSLILAEIAEHSIREKAADNSPECQIGANINAGQDANGTVD